MKKHNYVILFYDVKENRVNKVFKVCKKYLSHFQKSVFRGFITPSNIINLKEDLKKVSNKDEDFICLLKMINDNVFEEEIIGKPQSETGEDLII